MPFGRFGWYSEGRTTAEGHPSLPFSAAGMGEPAMLRGYTDRVWRRSIRRFRVIDWMFHCHEKDQKPVVRDTLDRNLDRGSHLVPRLRAIRPDGKHRSCLGVAGNGGDHRVPVDTALANRSKAEEPKAKSPTGRSFPQRPLPMRLRKEVQALLWRRCGNLIVSAGSNAGCGLPAWTPVATGQV